MVKLDKIVLAMSIAIGIIAVFLVFFVLLVNYLPERVPAHVAAFSHVNKAAQFSSDL